MCHFVTRQDFLCHFATLYIGDFMIGKTLKYMRFKKNAKQEFISKK